MAPGFTPRNVISPTTAERQLRVWVDNSRWKLGPRPAEGANAIINVDQTAAILRDFSNESYFPLAISSAVYRDMCGEAEALVRMSQGRS